MDTVAVGDDTLEARVQGDGDSLLLVQTALSVEEVASLGRHPSLAGGHRVIDLRRRGYRSLAPSPPPQGPGSVVRDAADCAAAIVALDAVPAHVAGASYSAAVALELAATHPELVRTLILVEPPPVEVQAGDAFRHANRHLLEVFEQHGVAAALEAFTQVLGTASWLAEREVATLELVAQVERDATVFFAQDVPALLSWRFGAEKAAQVGAPILYVGGADSGPWFAQVHSWVEQLFPQAEHHVLTGADHLLLTTHSDLVATLVADFLRRHAG